MNILKTLTPHPPHYNSKCAHSEDLHQDNLFADRSDKHAVHQNLAARVADYTASLPPQGGIESQEPRVANLPPSPSKAPANANAGVEAVNTEVISPATGDNKIIDMGEHIAEAAGTRQSIQQPKCLTPQPKKRLNRKQREDQEKLGCTHIQDAKPKPSHKRNTDLEQSDKPKRQRDRKQDTSKTSETKQPKPKPSEKPARSNRSRKKKQPSRLRGCDGAPQKASSQKQNQPVTTQAESAPG